MNRPESEHPVNFEEFCGICSKHHTITYNGETWMDRPRWDSTCEPVIWDALAQDWVEVDEEDESLVDFLLWKKQLMSELLLKDAIMDSLSTMDILDPWLHTSPDQPTE